MEYFNLFHPTLLEGVHAGNYLVKEEEEEKKGRGVIYRNPENSPQNYETIRNSNFEFGVVQKVKSIQI